MVMQGVFSTNTKNLLAWRILAAATSKMEHFVIIVNGWKLLTIITKSSILDAAAALDPPLRTYIIIYAIRSTLGSNKL